MHRPQVPGTSLPLFLMLTGVAMLLPACAPMPELLPSLSTHGIVCTNMQVLPGSSLSVMQTVGKKMVKDLEKRLSKFGWLCLITAKAINLSIQSVHPQASSITPHIFSTDLGDYKKK